MSSLISEYKNIPQYGILALVDESNKSVYIMFSNSLHTLVCTALIKLRGHIHENQLLQNAYDRDSLTSVVIKGYTEDPGVITFRNDYNAAVEEYRNKGYSNMRDNYNPLKFKLRKYVMNDFRGGRYPMVYVIAKSPSIEPIVLGVFEDMELAGRYIDEYKDSTVLPPKADNEMTRLYKRLYGDGLFE